jgi:hypothetical protein
VQHPIAIPEIIQKFLCFRNTSRLAFMKRHNLELNLSNTSGIQIRTVTTTRLKAANKKVGHQFKST